MWYAVSRKGIELQLRHDCYSVGIGLPKRTGGGGSDVEMFEILHNRGWTPNPLANSNPVSSPCDERGILLRRQVVCPAMTLVFCDRLEFFENNLISWLIGDHSLQTSQHLGFLVQREHPWKDAFSVQKLHLWNQGWFNCVPTRRHLHTFNQCPNQRSCMTLRVTMHCFKTRANGTCFGLLVIVTFSFAFNLFFWQ